MQRRPVTRSLTLKARMRHQYEINLFADPPGKEVCAKCLLPVPDNLTCGVSPFPATITSVPNYEYEIANNKLASMATAAYYTCCGKIVCKGCIHHLLTNRNFAKCFFCNAKIGTDSKEIKQTNKLIDLNDVNAMCLLANSYKHGINGLQMDHDKAKDLYTRAAMLGCGNAHDSLGYIYDDEVGDREKAKFHFEAAAMAGVVTARFNIGAREYNDGNMDRAIMHWTIAAESGCSFAMNEMITFYGKGSIDVELIEWTLAAYNSSCAAVKSLERETYVKHVVHEINLDV